MGKPTISGQTLSRALDGILFLSEAFEGRKGVVMKLSLLRIWLSRVN